LAENFVEKLVENLEQLSEIENEPVVDQLSLNESENISNTQIEEPVITNETVIEPEDLKSSRSEEQENSFVDSSEEHLKEKFVEEISKILDQSSPQKIETNSLAENFVEKLVENLEQLSEIENEPVVDQLSLNESENISNTQIEEPVITNETVIEPEDLKSSRSEEQENSFVDSSEEHLKEKFVEEISKILDQSSPQKIETNSLAENFVEKLVENLEQLSEIENEPVVDQLSLNESENISNTQIEEPVITNETVIEPEDLKSSRSEEQENSFVDSSEEHLKEKFVEEISKILDQSSPQTIETNSLAENFVEKLVENLEQLSEIENEPVVDQLSLNESENISNTQIEEPVITNETVIEPEDLKSSRSEEQENSFVDSSEEHLKEKFVEEISKILDQSSPQTIETNSLAENFVEKLVENLEQLSEIENEPVVDQLSLNESENISNTQIEEPVITNETVIEPEDLKSSRSEEQENSFVDSSEEHLKEKFVEEISKILDQSSPQKIETNSLAENFVEKLVENLEQLSEIENEPVVDQLSLNESENISNTQIEEPVITNETVIEPEDLKSSRSEEQENSFVDSSEEHLKEKFVEEISKILDQSSPQTIETNSLAENFVEKLVENLEQLSEIENEPVVDQLSLNESENISNTQIEEPVITNETVIEPEDLKSSRSEEQENSFVDSSEEHLKEKFVEEISKILDQSSPQKIETNSLAENFVEKLVENLEQLSEIENEPVVDQLSLNESENISNTQIEEPVITNETVIEPEDLKSSRSEEQENSFVDSSEEHLKEKFVEEISKILDQSSPQTIETNSLAENFVEKLVENLEQLSEIENEPVVDQLSLNESENISNTQIEEPVITNETVIEPEDLKSSRSEEQENSFVDSSEEHLKEKFVEEISKILDQSSPQTIETNSLAENFVEKLVENLEQLSEIENEPVVDQLSLNESENISNTQIEEPVITNETVIEPEDLKSSRSEEQENSFVDSSEEHLKEKFVEEISKILDQSSPQTIETNSLAENFVEKLVENLEQLSEIENEPVVDQLSLNESENISNTQIEEPVITNETVIEPEDLKSSRSEEQENSFVDSSEEHLKEKFVEEISKILDQSSPQKIETNSLAENFVEKLVENLEQLSEIENEPVVDQLSLNESENISNTQIEEPVITNETVIEPEDLKSSRSEEQENSFVDSSEEHLKEKFVEEISKILDQSSPQKIETNSLAENFVEKLVENLEQLSEIENEPVVDQLSLNESENISNTQIEEPVITNETVIEPEDLKSSRSEEQENSFVDSSEEHLKEKFVEEISKILDQSSPQKIETNSLAENFVEKLVENLEQLSEIENEPVVDQLSLNESENISNTQIEEPVITNETVIEPEDLKSSRSEEQENSFVDSSEEHLKEKFVEEISKILDQSSPQTIETNSLAENFVEKLVENLEQLSEIENEPVVDQLSLNESENISNTQIEEPVITNETVIEPEDLKSSRSEEQENSFVDSSEEHLKEKFVEEISKILDQSSPQTIETNSLAENFVEKLVENLEQLSEIENEPVVDQLSLNESENISNTQIEEPVITNETVIEPEDLKSSRSEEQENSFVDSSEEHLKEKFVEEISKILDQSSPQTIETNSLAENFVEKLVENLEQLSEIENEPVVDQLSLNESENISNTQIEEPVITNETVIEPEDLKSSRSEEQENSFVDSSEEHLKEKFVEEISKILDQSSPQTIETNSLAENFVEKLVENLEQLSEIENEPVVDQLSLNESENISNTQIEEPVITNETVIEPEDLKSSRSEEQENSFVDSSEEHLKEKFVEEISKILDQSSPQTIETNSLAENFVEKLVENLEQLSEIENEPVVDQLSLNESENISNTQIEEPVITNETVIEPEDLKSSRSEEQENSFVDSSEEHLKEKFVEEISKILDQSSPQTIETNSLAENFVEKLVENLEQLSEIENEPVVDQLSLNESENISNTQIEEPVITNETVIEPEDLKSSRSEEQENSFVDSSEEHLKEKFVEEISKILDQSSPQTIETNSLAENFVEKLVENLEQLSEIENEPVVDQLSLNESENISNTQIEEPVITNETVIEPEDLKSSRSEEQENSFVDSSEEHLKEKFVEEISKILDQSSPQKIETNSLAENFVEKLVENLEQLSEIENEPVVDQLSLNESENISNTQIEEPVITNETVIEPEDLKSSRSEEQENSFVDSSEEHLKEKFVEEISKILDQSSPQTIETNSLAENFVEKLVENLEQLSEIENEPVVDQLSLNESENISNTQIEEPVITNETVIEPEDLKSSRSEEQENSFVDSSEEHLKEKFVEEISKILDQSSPQTIETNSLAENFVEKLVENLEQLSEIENEPVVDQLSLNESENISNTQIEEPVITNETVIEPEDLKSSRSEEQENSFVDSSEEHLKEKFVEEISKILDQSSPQTIETNSLAENFVEKLVENLEQLSEIENEPVVDQLSLNESENISNTQIENFVEKIDAKSLNHSEFSFLDENNNQIFNLQKEVITSSNPNIKEDLCFSLPNDVYDHFNLYKDSVNKELLPPTSKGELKNVSFSLKEKKTSISENKQLKNSGDDSAVFDSYSNWDSAYTSGYSESIKIENTHSIAGEKQEQENNEMSKKEDLIGVANQQRPIFSNLLSFLPKISPNEFKNKLRTAKQNNKDELFDNNLDDINLTDYSKYQLVLPDDKDNISFSSFLKRSDEATLFPIYSINQKLVRLESINPEILEKRKPKNSGDDSAVFDSYSNWDSAYTSGYSESIKIENTHSIAGEKQEQVNNEMSKKEDLIGVANQQRPIFSNLLSFLPKISPNEFKNKLRTAKQNNKDELFDNNLDDINLTDYSKYQLVLPDDKDNISFSSFLKRSDEATLFPIYSINQKLVRLESINPEILEKRKLKNSGDDSAVFDSYSNWDSAYTSGYSESIKIENTHSIAGEKQEQENNEMSKKEDLIGVANQQRPIFSNLLSFLPKTSPNEFKNKLRTAKQNNKDELFDNNLDDINLTDYSKYQLVLPDDKDNISFSSFLKRSDEATLFPIYSINQKLVRLESINPEILEKRKLKNSGDDSAVFDSYSNWDSAYTSGYSESIKIENTHSIAGEKQEQENNEMSKKEDLIGVANQQRPIFSNLLSFLPKTSPNEFKNKLRTAKQNNKDELFDNNLDDINLTDYSKYQLVLPDDKDNISFSSFLKRSDEATLFPIYSINQKLVRLESINPEILEKRKLKNSGDDSAVFDSYSNWDSAYTSGYSESIKIENTHSVAGEKQEQENNEMSKKEDLIGVANQQRPIFSNLLSFLPKTSPNEFKNKLRTAKQNNKDELFDNNLDDINLTDYSKYQLVLPDDKDNISFSSFLKRSDEATLFPIYSINQKLVRLESINPEILEKRKLKNSGDDSAVFDSYSNWDSAYTSGYSESIKIENTHSIAGEKQEQENNEMSKKEDLIGVANQQRPIFSNLLSFLPKTSPNEFKNKLRTAKQNNKDELFDNNLDDINLTDYSKYQLVLPDDKDNISFSSFLKRSDEATLFPIYSINQKLVRLESINPEILEKRKLKNSGDDSAVFDSYSNWDSAYTSGYSESIKIENTHSIAGEKQEQENNEMSKKEDLIGVANQQRPIFSNLLSFLPKTSPNEFKNKLRTAKQNNKDELFDNNLDDINLTDYSKYQLVLPDDKDNISFSSFLKRSDEATLFPIYSINQKLVRLESINPEILEKRKLKNSGDDSAVFDSYSNWDSAYTSGYSESIKIENTHSIAGEKQEQENNEMSKKEDLIGVANQQRPIFSNLLSFLPKISPNEFKNKLRTAKQNNKDELFDNNLDDINLTDYSKYQLVLPDDKDNISFSSFLKRSDEATLFPIYSINQKLVRLESINPEILEKRKLKNSGDDSAVFDSYSNWDSAYTSGYSESIKIENTHSIAGEKQEQENNEMSKKEDLIGVANQQRPIFSNLLSFLPKISPNEFKKRKHDFDLNESSFDSLTFIETPFSYSPISELGNFFSKFQCSSFSDFSILYQEQFYRAPLVFDNKEIMKYNTPLNVFNLKSDKINISHIEYFQFHDICKTKPYFDDFAQYPSQYFEFSRYFLESNSNKFYPLNSQIRSRTPYFFLDDFSLNMNSHLKLSSYSNLYGHFLLSAGAFALLVFTLI
jgi:golgin subfamily B member 1